MEPGSATASAVGIGSSLPEDVATRAGRALRVALLTCTGTCGEVDGDTVRLWDGDEFALGVAAARAQVALRGEGLVTTLTRVPPATRPADAGRAAQPCVLIHCQ